MGLSGLPLGAGVLAPPLPLITYTSQRPTADELKELHLAAFGVDKLNTAGAAAEFLTGKNKILRFAYDGSRLVGYGIGEDATSLDLYLRYLRLKKMPQALRTIYIPLFAAHPDYQGQGIGRELLEQTLCAAADEGYVRGCGIFKDGRPHDLAQKVLQVSRDERINPFLMNGKCAYYFVYGRLKRPGRSALH